MDTITLKAYAKINLFLEVCEKRKDNYHNIDSVMQAVTLCDVITVEKHNEIVLSNSANLPNDKSNLAYKAAALFFDHTGIIGGCKIHIEKNIPISAGLAGGSTDAGAVLRGLNAIYETNLTVDTLCTLGAKLGADVPFCIKGECLITKGIGDVFEPCPSLPQSFIVIAKNGEGVSTPYAYGEIDKSRESKQYNYKSSNKIVESLKTASLEEITQNCYNVFETVVCPIRPMVDEQKKIMYNYNALFSMMSGSGPSVFGIFKNKDDAEKAVEALKNIGSDAHLCLPIKK